MRLDTDPDGNILVKASGEDGRVTLMMRDGSTLIITERRGNLFTTDDGLVKSDEYRAGRTAGIVKGADWR
jgi:hypothetical protein